MAPAPTDTKTGNGIVYRRYEPKDHASICRIFREGMETNAVAAWRSVCSAPAVVGIMLSAGTAVGSVVVRLLILSKSHDSSSSSSGGGVHASSSVVIGLGASSLTVIGLATALYCRVSRGFGGYIDQSLNDDLKSSQNLLTVYGNASVRQSCSVSRFLSFQFQVFQHMHRCPV